MASHFKINLDKLVLFDYYRTMKLTKQIAIFKALASEQRLRLFLMIAQNCCGKADGYEKAFTEACECLPIGRSTVSHHLKELQKAGLIICERDGQSMRCKVNGSALELIRQVLA